MRIPETDWTADNKINIGGEILSPNEAIEKYPELRTEIEYREIRRTVDEILDLPQIKNAPHPIEAAFYLYKYVIENSVYDEQAFTDKQSDTPENIVLREIYRCLCNRRSVCTGDAQALSLLFREIGLDSVYVGIADKGSKTPDGKYTNGHAVVAINVGNKRFYCDPTLFRILSEKNGLKITTANFAFPSEVFLGKFYPDKEITFTDNPKSLEIIYATAQSEETPERKDEIVAEVAEIIQARAERKNK